MILNLLAFLVGPDRQHLAYVYVQQAFFLVVVTFILVRARQHASLYLLALIAFVAIVSSGTSSVYDVTWLSESFGRSLALLTAFLFLFGIVGKSRGMLFLSGVSWGCENLVRMLTVGGPFVLVSVACLVLVLEKNIGRKLLSSSLWVLAGHLVVVSALLLRNMWLVGRPVLSVWAFWLQIPFACKGQAWNSGWDASLWWDRMHLDEGTMAGELQAAALACVADHPAHYLKKGIGLFLASFESFSDMQIAYLGLVAVAIIQVLRFRWTPAGHRSMLAGVAAGVFAAALWLDVPWLAALAFVLIGSIGVVALRGALRIFAGMVFINVLVALLANALSGGVARYVEVIAWAPALLIGITVVGAKDELLQNTYQNFENRYLLWFERGMSTLLVVCLLGVLCAAVATTWLAPGRVPEIENMAADNQRIYDDVVASRNRPQWKTQRVRLAGYVAGVIGHYSAGQGDRRAAAYSILEGRERTVFDLIIPIQHFGRMRSITIPVLRVGSKGAPDRGTPMLVEGTLYHFPAEPYHGRYLLLI